MVGRSSEFAQLQHVTEELKAGRGQVVIVTGEAGIGKSRLMAEWQVPGQGDPLAGGPLVFRPTGCPMARSPT